MTMLVSSANPSTAGRSITYTATISALAAMGTVEFKDGDVVISGCADRAVSFSVATCTVGGYATTGSRSITATYSGDGSYLSSTSSTFTQTILSAGQGTGQAVSKKGTTTTAVSSALDPSTVGEAVTLTAVVSPAAATGTVEFKQSGVVIGECSAQAVSSGIATCTVTSLPAGGRWVTANYSGDSNYAASWSPGLTQTVKKKITTTAVSSALDPSTVGHAVTYTATVSPASTTGTVEFKEEMSPIAGCSAELISSGIATCTVTGYPKWSSYGITADYSGDSGDLASASSTFTQTVEPPAESATPFRFFSPTSFWNEEVPAGAPLDSSSVEVVGALDKEVTKAEEAIGGQPTINTGAWSVPVYTVPADQPLVKITQTIPYGGKVDPALQAAWEEVPLPANARPAAGTDKHLVVWQPSTGKLWELWSLEDTEKGWQAKWGGAIENESSDSGAYGPEAWPGAQTSWGASASSLSIAGGLITLEDLEKGEINHALAMAVPNTREGVYASPAQRTDGMSTEPGSLPEGAHLRLDPNLDLASLHLPKLTLMMAEAAQRYGIFVRDSAQNVAFYGQDPIPTGTEPYTGAHGFYEGKSAQQIVAAFPWSHLELLKMELHGSA